MTPRERWTFNGLSRGQARCPLLSPWMQATQARWLPAAEAILEDLSPSPRWLPAAGRPQVLCGRSRGAVPRHNCSLNQLTEEAVQRRTGPLQPRPLSTVPQRRCGPPKVTCTTTRRWRFNASEALALATSPQGHNRAGCGGNKGLSILFFLSGFLIPLIFLGKEFSQTEYTR